MKNKFTKIAASLAGIAFISGVAAFTPALLSDDQSVIKVAQANDTVQGDYKDKKKRKGSASK